MRDDIIDTVFADDLEPKDFIKQGEVLKVEEDESDTDYVLVTVDGEDEPLRFLYSTRIDLYGAVSVEI